MGPAAALDLAMIGCGAPLGLASGIASSQGGYIGGGQGCCHMESSIYGNPSGFSMDSSIYGNPGQGRPQVPVIARPILPYFRSTGRGFPKW